MVSLVVGLIIALLPILVIVFLIKVLGMILGSVGAGTWIAIAVGIVAIIAAIILLRFLIAALKKPAPCRCCQKSLKGIEQLKWGWGTPNAFVICKECAAKVHPQLAAYAKEHWSYKDFEDYLLWDKETAAQRSNFVVTEHYGEEKVLMIDSTHGLFSIGKHKMMKAGEPGIILRFEDLADFEIDFQPEEVKNGVLGDKVRGKEYLKISMNRPVVSYEEALNSLAEYSLRKKGFIKTDYQYDMAEGFIRIISVFKECVAKELARRGEAAPDSE
ncbi:MAG: hypothetical protein K5686_11070, partial [Lachnospiraceae bacterium]|nr:hypothetical protein [Lachnospiraceae bacterium]